ncbi:peptide deformylase [Maritalea mediterranea]|uniref:Peptide deformylase n=1 Tax=Maritalea mediterranea TaxID=2909667 RepID=A0ABS9E5J4_9HYPH|nr:peptide deformylase [Maritalea mediterranea]MCF4097492.1 peptide deformylase [Maritalea mediterranea]
MTIRPILHIPNDVLRKVAAPVDTVNDEIKTLIKDMFDTMYDAPGVGLAAPQIGELHRVIVMDPSKEEEEPNPIAMINPEITWSSEDTWTYQEGCLSIPEYYEDVERPVKVRVKYLDEEGNPQELEAEELLSTIVQHEIDHLDGKLFIDYLSRLKRERVTKKFQKIAKRKAG